MENSRNDIFISYSRRDKAFMQQIYDRLRQQGYDAWVDTDDIPTGENFLNEIHAGIEGAHTVLFITSPDSLASEICNQEIAYSIQLRKRIIPIVCREILMDNQLGGDVLAAWSGKVWESAARQNWEQVRHINWILAREADDQEDAYRRLVDALETDGEYVKFHRRMTVRALDWQKSGYKPEFLMRGAELHQAEGWLAISQDKRQIPPTELHQRYIEHSVAARQQAELAERERQQRELRQQRYIFGLFGALAVLGIIFLAVAFIQERRVANAPVRLFEDLVEDALSQRDPIVAQQVCIVGTTAGFAEVVLPACDHAIAVADPRIQAYFRDARAYANAMLGNYEAAAADFEASTQFLQVNNIVDDDNIDLRQRWIRTLNNDENPFENSEARAAYLSGY